MAPYRSNKAAQGQVVPRGFCICGPSRFMIEAILASSKRTAEKSLSAMAAALTSQFIGTLREMRDLT